MDEPMRTLEDLAAHTGQSLSYWYKQSAKRRFPCSRFGGHVRFTPEQWAATLALYEDRPKVVPTRDEVAAKRAASTTRGRRRVA